jgi:hypothetical protein
LSRAASSRGFVLEKAEIPAPQARAIARAIDIEIAASCQSLATRTDVLLESGTLRTAMYGALLTQLAVLLGLAYFFVDRLT